MKIILIVIKQQLNQITGERILRYHLQIKIVASNICEVSMVNNNDEINSTYQQVRNLHNP